MAIVYVAAEYDEEDLSRAKRLKIVMTAETEKARGFETGQTVTIGRKPYTLGARESLDDGIVHFNLSANK